MDGSMSALVKWFREFVGPAPSPAAGMIGAGAVATRLLAGRGSASICCGARFT
jgi:hypothetical protein